MKKLWMTVVLVLAFAVSASAAVKEFEACTVDVPDGWITQAQGPVAIIASPDGGEAVTLIVAPSQGQDAKTIAETGAKSVNGTDLRADGDAWTFKFDQSGQKGTMRVWVVGDKAVIGTLMGDTGKLMDILKTVQVK